MPYPVSAVRGKNFGAALPPFDFDPALVTFTAGMAKRAGPSGIWAGAPIVQGHWDGSGTPDVLSFARGAQVASNFYAQFDPYQGGGFCVWTPEQSSADRSVDAYLWSLGGLQYYLFYDYDSNRFEFRAGGQDYRVNATVTAGTPIYLAWGFDCNSTLDGTNYAYLSINDTQTYGNTTQPTAYLPGSNNYVGIRATIKNPANGIIEGLTFVREIPWTGTYGTDMGQGDIVAAHAAGADVCLSIGSWGVTFCLPTNATTGALATGTGEAWSHQHSSNLLPGNSNVGGFMMDGTYTNDGWADEGTPSAVAALAAAEKILPGGYKVTSDAANEGIYDDITVSAGDDVVIRAIGHSDGTSVPHVILYDQDNTAEIASLSGSNGSTRAAPDVFEFAGEAPGGCTTIRVKLINTDATAADVTYWHQCEVLANLWDDPGMEAGTAVTNVGTPTTSAQDATQAHTDTNSWKIVADAADEGMKRAITTTSGIFYHATAWVYADTSGTVDMEGPTLQDGSTTKVTTATNDAWERLEFVFRATAASTDLQFTSNAAQTFYVDDVAVVALDNVSVTATPASEANSAETSGTRVDGRDTCTQTISNLKANKGKIRWTWTPRHDAADLVKHGNTTSYIITAYKDGDNYIYLAGSSANTISLRLRIGGTNYTTAWDCTGAIVAGTTYTMEVKYTATTATLSVDGVAELTNSPGPGIDFGANVPDTMYWGSSLTGIKQADATFAAPTP